MLTCPNQQTVISFIALIYLLLSTGPSRPFKILPWFIFGQLALDAVLFIFWLAAAATNNLDCDDLCNACNWSNVVYGQGICYCLLFKEKRAMSPNPAKSLLGKRDLIGVNRGTVEGTVALDAIMTCVFLCFCACLYIPTAINESHR